MSIERSLLFNVSWFVRVSLLTVLTLSCQKQKSGTLYVASDRDGKYEVYRIQHVGTDLEYTSELIGAFNQDQPLSPGQYLLLADCSHRVVIVRAGQKIFVQAHQLEFVPPHPQLPGDVFSVQCDRYHRVSRQRFSNRYSFDILGDNKNILVGMHPFKVTFPAGPETQRDSHLHRVSLAAIKIAEPREGTFQMPYFVSSVGLHYRRLSLKNW